jgi:hypothetical protein
MYEEKGTPAAVAELARQLTFSSRSRLENPKKPSQLYAK